MERTDVDFTPAARGVVDHMDLHVLILVDHGEIYATGNLEGMVIGGEGGGDGGGDGDVSGRRWSRGWRCVVPQQWAAAGVQIL